MKLSPAARCEKELRLLAASPEWSTYEPLPTTRQLAAECGTSNATVHRILSRLATEGIVWRNENGRHYQMAARARMDKPRPVACLVRTLRAWSFSYQAIMAGFSDYCGVSRHSIILPHHDFLVRHPDPSVPPQYGTAARQEAALRQFLHLHSLPMHGFFLDHLWQDKVLHRFRGHMNNAVMVWRCSTLEEVSSVSPDLALGAALALGHLAARGYRRVLLVRPFSNDEVTESFLQHALVAGKTMGFSLREGDIRMAATESDRIKLVREAVSSSERVALFCPEDNISILLEELLAKAGGKRFHRVGLLSGMGTEALLRREISSVVLPFQQMGTECARLLEERSPRRIVLPVELRIGKST